jgi:hypothetical protein
MHAAVRRIAARHTEDRAMDGEIEAVLVQYHSGELPCGENDFA